MGYKLNILLPILLEPISKEQKDLLDKANNVRDIRNKVVHEGRFATFKEAELSVITSSEIIKFIDKMTNE